MMWWGSGYGWIWMLLSWAVIIGLVVWAVNTFAGRDARDNGASSPRRILDERFARGEIDEEEYRRRRDELER
ncbi:MAG: SHOCT domain-containing protein [Actinobacteria bacterium]|nr:SHOCT domain-containing protein [Actinomycetota bacterium]